MSIGVAIVGSGIFAKESHLPAVLATPLLSLKAIYSRSLDSAKALEAGTAVDLYSDDSGSGNTYHDLLLRDDIQAVIIALPIMNQPEYIEAAIKAGKSVLSEKPIAGDLKRARKLLGFAEKELKEGVTWSVAENYRFLDNFVYARTQVERLGAVTGFRAQVFGNVKVGDKYFETDWRKKPDHQGGFLLDGGVHFCAGLRYLLSPSAIPTALSSFSTLLKPHLPPVDTINAIWLLSSGVSGTFQNSFGTTLSGSNYVISCEKGSVHVGFNNVIVYEGEEKEGKKTEQKFLQQKNGVPQEVKAWAESLKAGKQDPLQSPREALADLELLEAMLTSGTKGGELYKLEHQTA